METKDSFAPLVWIAAVAIAAIQFISDIPFLLQFFSSDHLPIGNAVSISALGIVCVGLAWWCLIRSQRTGNAFLMAISGSLGLNALLLTVMGYASAYRTLGLIDTASQVQTNDPATCIYFSIITLTTVGYGDFRPTGAARFAAASEAILGFLIMAALIAAFGRILLFLFDRSSRPQKPGDAA